MERTYEITDYCPHNCKFCSTNATNDYDKANFLTIEKIKTDLLEISNEGREKIDHIILSGGEPLSHPNFYKILNLCKKFSDDVVVYSNAITHLIYDAHVIDGVYLECNVTALPEVDKIHVLRRVKQGREANRPEVHLSKNFKESCSCEHRVMRPNGKLALTPCNKWNFTNE